MSTDYFVACKTCKVVRGLDTFYTSDIYPVENRQQALEFADRIKNDSFRAGLLVSFMGKHKNHEIVFFTEHDRIAEECDPYFGFYEEGGEFWHPCQV